MKEELNFEPELACEPDAIEMHADGGCFGIGIKNLNFKIRLQVKPEAFGINKPAAIAKL